MDVVKVLDTGRRILWQAWERGMEGATDKGDKEKG